MARSQIIIHVDMDAFYASVEIRDDPGLAGKPLIIGALPSERGVVATCSYEARKFGVHSAMNIKEAYRLCPNAVYMHPDFEKYRKVSAQIRNIWNDYAVVMETVALDEAYLDVTYSAGSFERAGEMAREIQSRIRSELGLTCSVGVAYSKTAAKTASEEKKPNGYFEIPDAEAFVELMSDRDVRALYTVGGKTAEKLNRIGIHTVRDIQERREEIEERFGKHGRLMTELAMGIDDRRVTAYKPEDAKSLSREITFQEDVSNYDLLRDALLLLALSVEERAGRHGLHGYGVTLKLTYADMKSITRSRIVTSAANAATIYTETLRLLDQVEKRPVRLVGAGIYNLSGDEGRQMTIDDYLGESSAEDERVINAGLQRLGEKYGLDFAGHLDDIYKGTVLYRTIEYMRKHYPEG
ncbi:MAG: DNA polymerase IV [Clostridiales bacterium]|nr:DNA polymerase IV [Clostridiales bacterium]